LAVAALVAASLLTSACASEQEPRSAGPTATTATSGPLAPPERSSAGGLDLPTTTVPRLAVPTTVPESLELPGFDAALVIETCELRVSVTNEALGFAYDSAEVSSTGRSSLSAVADQLDGAKVVRIVGHSSTEGDGAYNQTLSERRARAVADELAALGVRATFEVIGAGETEPLVAPDDDEDERAQNRRVVITAEVEAEVCS
jgi:outer membrane protein OmpA-like peptidoglycan-associated protein